ncbi:MAG: DUF4388 domain-containing protein, partial [Actinomycetes bacterium]
MPEGALLTNTVEATLHELAAAAATGCLVVRDQEGDEAEVYLRGGDVYAVMVPGRRVMLGVRLMSRGALTPEALAEALEIQRTELQGWRLGELLVHLGYVELSVVEEFVLEHLKDAMADLLGWPVSAWKFRRNKKTRQDVAPPTPVATLLDDLRDRATTWEQILESIGGPESVPYLASGSPSDGVALGPNEWALLCKVDADRSVADLAAECGFTLFEAGQVVTRLVEAGLVSVEAEPSELAGPELVLPVVPLAEAEEREQAAGSERAQAERVAAEQAERERAEAEARAQAEREQAEREQAEREQAEGEQAEAEALEQAEREQAEREQAEAEALEQAEREQAEREAAERAERERAEAEAREQAEREQAEREAAEQAER